MEKAYSLAGLIEIMKGKGLPGLEAAAEAEAKIVYEAFKEWFSTSAKMTSNPFDDMVVPFFAQADAVILPKIEQIDIDGDGK